MGEVIEIGGRKPKEFLSGEALCVACNRTWISVVPSNGARKVMYLECPYCHENKGVLPNPPEKYWVCSCGTDTFKISDTAVYCSSCNQMQAFP